MLAAASAIATGLALGGARAMVRVPLMPTRVGAVHWIIAGDRAVIAALIATPRLRTLREPLLALPLTVLAAALDPPGWLDLTLS